MTDRAVEEEEPTLVGTTLCTVVRMGAAPITRFTRPIISRPADVTDVDVVANAERFRRRRKL